MGACNDTLRFLFVNESLVPTKDLTLTDAPILGVQSSQGWSLAEMGRGHNVINRYCGVVVGFDTIRSFAILDSR